MKKFILSVALGAVFCSCDAQHQLTVKFPALKSDTVTVALVDKAMRSIEKQDKVVAQNGEITYDVEGDKARLVMINYVTTKGPGRMQAYVVPGEQGVLTMSEDGGKWSGSAFYSTLAKLEEITDPIEGEMNQIGADFQKRVQAGENADDVRKEIMPKYSALQEKLSKAQQEYFDANTSSDVAATIISNLEDAEAAMNKLAPAVRNGKFSEVLDNVQKQIDADKAQKEAAKKVAPGMPAPEITLNDINGKPFSLSSLRGKYVVLDFWGSWCGWCIKGFPEMKEYYKKYAGKFEILGIDCNDTEDKWKKAVADNELPWLHVYNPRNSDVTTQYAITGYPTKIIVGPDGKIAKTIVGESPEFYTYLDELFGK